MAPAILLLAFVLLVALAAGAGYVLGLSSASKEPSQTAAVAERDAFIQHLRELAWQHRDVAPELSTIVIDEINTRQRRLSGTDD